MTDIAPFKPCITASMGPDGQVVFKVNSIVLNSFTCYGITAAELRWILSNPKAIQLLASPLAPNETELPRPSNIKALLIAYAFSIVVLWLLAWVIISYGYSWSQPATSIVLVVTGVITLILTLGFFGYIAKRLFKAMYNEKTAIAQLRAKINSYNPADNYCEVKKKVKEGEIALTKAQAEALAPSAPAATTVVLPAPAITEPSVALT